MNQTVEMIPDVIGMGWAAEVQAQLEVGELGGIGEVGAGDQHLLIGYHRFDMTDSLRTSKETLYLWQGCALREPSDKSKDLRQTPVQAIVVTTSTNRWMSQILLR